MAHPGYTNAVAKVGFAHCPVEKHWRFASQQGRQPYRDHGGCGGQHDAQPLTGQLAQARGKNQRPHQDIPATAQAGAVGQQGMGRGCAHLHYKGIGNGGGLLRYGKAICCGRRKPARRGRGIRLGLPKLARRRQQTIAHGHQLFKIWYAVAVRAFKPECQIHQGQAVQPQIATKGHVVC